METTDSSQLDIYTKDKLIACKVPINSKVTLKHPVLPRDKK